MKTTKVKEYYIKIEKIDCVDIFDHFKGVESFFLRFRERFIRKLIKEYGRGRSWERGLFLDVGCGTGVILRNLPLGSVGLDINPWNVRRAKRYASKADLVLGDAENLPFKENAFLTIICSEALEHLENPYRSVREMYRVLKNTGVLIGSVPHPSFLWRLVDWGHMKLSNEKYRQALAHFHLLSSRRSYKAPFHKLYTSEEVRGLLSPFKILRNNVSFLNLHIFFVARKQTSSEKN